MDALGINWSYLAIQLTFVVIWILPSLFAQYDLRSRHLIVPNQVLWALLIVCIPVLSALANFIVKPINNN